MLPVSSPFYQLGPCDGFNLTQPRTILDKSLNKGLCVVGQTGWMSVGDCCSWVNESSPIVGGTIPYQGPGL